MLMMRQCSIKNYQQQQREMEVKIVSRLSTKLCKYVKYNSKLYELDVTFTLNLI